MAIKLPFDRLPSENESNPATVEERGAQANPSKNQNSAKPPRIPTFTAEHTDQENERHQDLRMDARQYPKWIIEQAPGLSEAKKDEVRSDLKWLNSGQPKAPTPAPFIGPPEAEFCQDRLKELMLHCIKLRIGGRGLTGITADEMRALKRYVNAQLEQWDKTHIEYRRKALTDLLPRVDCRMLTVEILQTALMFYRGELLDMPDKELVLLKQYLEKQDY